MGVPSYFHWLVSKFEDEILKGIAPSNASPEEQLYNPGINVDYLYLDLNCAIHPAVKQPGLTREQMYVAVGTYIENILRTSEPRKLLYIAIDGVAPRAKMAQQRKRRYKTVQDTEQRTKLKGNLRCPLSKGKIST